MPILALIAGILAALNIAGVASVSWWIILALLFAPVLAASVVLLIMAAAVASGAKPTVKRRFR